MRTGPDLTCAASQRAPGLSENKAKVVIPAGGGPHNQPLSWDKQERSVYLNAGTAQKLLRSAYPPITHSGAFLCARTGQAGNAPGRAGRMGGRIPPRGTCLDTPEGYKIAS